jgi:microcystin-dependent protein
LKKNRATLKDYFKKGAIPTDAQFADLIDSMLNQEEDNINKLPNAPLSITATGTDESLVNFYRLEQNDPTLSWQFKQKPDGKTGLTISDAAAARLFIQSGTGSVGIGTTTPGAKLQVFGNQERVSLRVGSGDVSGNDFTMDVAMGQGMANLVAGAKIKPDGSGYTFLGTRGASRISLHDGIIHFHTSDITSGTPNADAVGLNSGSAKMTVTNTGRVGIGTPAPAAQLDVSKAAAGQLGGTLRISNPGGGGGSQSALEFTTFDVGANPPGARILATDNSSYSADIDFQTKNSGAAANPLTTRLKITANGNIGLGAGAAVPRTRLDTGTGVLSGAANDYVKAQFTMSGGGTVYWGGFGKRLKWSNRFIAISMEQSVSFSSGHVNIYQPNSDIPAGQVYDGLARSATADGIVLNHWEALYAVHTVGGNESAVTYQIVRYTNTINAPSNWLLVALVNGDDNSIRLGTGVILSANSSSSQSSPFPRGGIIMWSGDSGNLPGGWALCDGGNSTPDLRNRFIVGAGASYGVGATGGADTVTLTGGQMPSHNHNNGEYGVLLHRDGAGRWTSKDTDTTVGEPDLIHNADIQPAGGNQAHENRPPYYALAYIMKL